MREHVTRSVTLAGAVAAAVAASACCIGPLVLAVLGIGGAGLFVALEPYRPMFVVATLGLLGSGWYLALRPLASTHPTPPLVGASGEDCGCPLPRANKAGKRALWLTTGVAGLALAFPWVAPYLF